MEGRLYAHLLEVEDAAQDLLDSMMPGMAKETRVTEDLKARDPMHWGADELLQVPGGGNYFCGTDLYLVRSKVS